MHLSAPKQVTFWIAVLLATIGLVAKLVPIVALAPYAFWLVLAALIILQLGTLLEGF